MAKKFAALEGVESAGSGVPLSCAVGHEISAFNEEGRSKLRPQASTIILSHPKYRHAPSMTVPRGGLLFFLFLLAMGAVAEERVVGMVNALAAAHEQAQVVDAALVIGFVDDA